MDPRSHWQHFDIQKAVRSPSGDGNRDALVQPSAPWFTTNNGRHRLPHTPIQTAPSFEGFSSPFPPVTYGARSNLQTSSKKPFEGSLDGINYIPSPLTVDNYYALEEPYAEHPSLVSHLVYCFDPQHVTSTWHYPMGQKPEDQKPSPSFKLQSPVRQPHFDDLEKISPVAYVGCKRKNTQHKHHSMKLRKFPNQISSPPNKLKLGHETPMAEELEASGKTIRSRKAITTWYQRYNDLVDFKHEFGHTNVPQKYAANHSLGVWVNKQRMEMKARLEGSKSNMTEHRIDLLKRINFEWAKPKGQAAWDEKFQELVEYKREHGDCHVPTKHRNNRPLGRWVSTQRHMYKDYLRGHKPKSLEHSEIKRRIAKLEAIGFAWSMLSSSSDEGEQSV